MATLHTLVQNAIIRDFQNDPNMNQYPIRAKEYGGTKAGEDFYPNSQNQSPVVITVSARDQGHIQTFVPINRVIVEIQIIYNGSADNFSLSAALLDTLSEAASDRLQGHVNVGDQGREQTYATSSGGALQIFGILDDIPSRHESSGFQRIKTVSRTFIAAHVAGQAL